MTLSYGVGQICVWDGGSIWIGKAGAVTDVHAHHAVQVALALEGRFKFQSPVDDGWLDCAGAVISSDHPHAFDGRDAALLAHIFIEPESLPGRVLLTRFQAANGICLMDGAFRDSAAAELLIGHSNTRTSDELIAAARAAIRLLTDSQEAPAPADPRILKALEHLRDHLDGPVTLNGVAAMVNLSPSRFRHLFIKEVGLAFRPYVLWLRLGRAVEAVAAGETLTTAAYRAGFADSAHLSRTFRRMYGIAAGALQLK